MKFLYAEIPDGYLLKSFFELLKLKKAGFNNYSTFYRAFINEYGYKPKNEKN